MARIRSVKPDLRTSAVVASWPRDVRYSWVLLWGYLDDAGRGLDVPKGIAGDCFPHDDDVTPRRMDAWLTTMTHGLAGRPGPLCRYQVGQSRYLHCVNWSEHQRVQRPTASRLPPCPLHESSVSDSANPSGGPPEGDRNSHGPDATRGLGDGDGDGDGVLPSVVQRANAPTTKGTRLPDDFAPTEAMIAWARDHAPTAARADHEAFVDYWRAQPGQRGRKADWPATWRNWMRREHERRSGTGRPPAPTKIDYNGLRLNPKTVEDLEGRHRMAALDRAEAAAQAAIEPRRTA